MNTSTIDNLSQILMVFFVFVLVISGNYIGELLPCKIQTIMSNNIYVKHFFGYLTILFLVIVAIPDIQKKYDIQYLPFFGLLCYSFFVIIAKTHYKLWIIIICLMSIIFILTSLKKNINDELILNKINILEKTLIVCILFFSIFGIIIYYKEKQIEYKKKFTLAKFFLGTIGCRNNKSFTYF